MKAIQVKYLRATDTQGERMKAGAVNWGLKQWVGIIPLTSTGTLRLLRKR